MVIQDSFRPSKAKKNTLPISRFRGPLGRLLVFSLLLIGSPHLSANENRVREFAQQRILVHPQDSASENEFKTVLEAQGGRILNRIRNSNLHLVAVPRFAEHAIVEILRRHPKIKFAELDELVELTETVPNDANYSQAWHLPKIGAPKAWDHTKGSGITVAILDSGVYAAHPDLAGKLVAGTNTVDNSSNTGDVMGHGTKVAGVVGAASNNGVGVASVAWNAKLMPIRVSNRSDGAAYTSDLAEGIYWAADHGARVANLSFDVSNSPTIQNAAKYLKDRGGVTVIAAGNSGSEQAYTASEDIIVISATTSADARAGWSSYGHYVDFAAPGAGIWTTTKSGDYGSASGTSFAAPTAAGAIALLLSLDPSLNSASVKQILKQTASDLGSFGYDPHFGHGRIDVGQAVTSIVSDTEDTEAPSIAFVNQFTGPISGTTTVEINASDNQSVASVSLRLDNTLIGTDNSEPYRISLNSENFANGEYDLTATAIDTNGNSASTTVSIQIQNQDDDTVVPTVTLVTDFSKIYSGTINIAADATDNIGIKKVEFLVDGWVKKVDSSAPYHFSLDTTELSDGNHTIVARAFDEANNSQSDSKILKVNNAPAPDTERPTVSFSTTFNSSVSGTINILANASDNVAVAQVQLFVNGSLHSADTSAPYSFNLDTTQFANGTYTLNLRALDTAGNENTTQTQLVVDNSPPADTNAPTVNFTNNFNAPISGSITVNVTATDNVGVTEVRLHVNNSLIAKDVNTPYAFSLDTTNYTNGTHTLSATAFDAAGNQSSTNATIQIDNLEVDTTPPTVEIINDLSHTVTGTIILEARATDNVGVTKVEFLRNGWVMAVSARAPYQYVIDTTTLSNGTYNVTARAYDAAGNKHNHTVSIKVQHGKPEDTLPPTLSLKTDLSFTISGRVQLHAEAEDASGINRVEFLIDDNLVLSDTTAPYEYALDTTLLKNGEHNLTLIAFDNANNMKKAQLTFNVNNQTQQDPDPDTTSPELTISGVRDRQRISGLISMGLEATDATKVVWTRLKLNNVILSQKEQNILRYGLDTTKYPNGIYRLEFSAADEFGNLSTKTISVKIRQPRQFNLRSAFSRKRFGR